jgi:hypothetical protein
MEGDSSSPDPEGAWLAAAAASVGSGAGAALASLGMPVGAALLPTGACGPEVLLWYLGGWTTGRKMLPVVGLGLRCAPRGTPAGDEVTPSCACPLPGCVPCLG